MKRNPTIWLLGLLLAFQVPSSDSTLLACALDSVVIYVSIIAIVGITRIAAVSPSPAPPLAALLKMPVPTALRLGVLYFAGVLLLLPLAWLIIQVTAPTIFPSTSLVTLDPSPIFFCAVLLTPLSVPVQLAQCHFILADPSIPRSFRNGWSMLKSNPKLLILAFSIIIALQVIAAPLVAVGVLAFQLASATSGPPPTGLVFIVTRLLSAFLLPISYTLRATTYLGLAPRDPR